ncbi:RDD family protein [Pontibacter cellulosilyticus]|uniref:RDD family protein n=1 Tax=Pontibacter cellulosilyticus TaxID=1720253 RepID=A0A923N5U3_9BACT|nr:RDD family protein [Pontibacter cellulosilyticus]MBC5993450.1 RDD family protein [Pontibacter cellulosilyticus]
MQAIYTQTDKKVELADLSKRIIAFTLDLLLLLSLIGLIDYLTYSSDEQAYLFKPERILDFSLGWLYFAGMEICACQATLGKYLLGLRVTSTTGNRTSFKSATIRYFAKPISVVLVILRFIFGIFPISRRTFHDKLANTMVVTR